MNLVLYNQLGGAFEVSATNWNQTLSLARMYGWQPAGTLRPPLPFGLVKGYPADRPWNGNYDSAHGQCVSRRTPEIDGSVNFSRLAVAVVSSFVVPSLRDPE